MSGRLNPFQLKLFFSNRYVYAQVVRRGDGHIVASASTLEQSVRKTEGSKSDTSAAQLVGQTVAERARAANVASVHYQKPRGKPYHGKLAALIASMVKNGLPLS
eukprot:jgi/Chlat1/9192/Chrsp97S08464